jgi:hypothetical protein
MFPWTHYLRLDVFEINPNTLEVHEDVQENTHTVVELEWGFPLVVKNEDFSHVVFRFTIEPYPLSLIEVVDIKDVLLMSNPQFKVVGDSFEQALSNLVKGVKDLYGEVPGD